jgi:hypothetical protein
MCRFLLIVVVYYELTGIFFYACLALAGARSYCGELVLPYCYVVSGPRASWAGWGVQLADDNVMVMCHLNPKELACHSFIVPIFFLCLFCLLVTCQLY